MLKKKSIDYIFGMITGISVTITFWACTTNDLVASNDTSTPNDASTNTVQQVEITNWSDMPAVKISSLGNNVDCDISNTPTVKISSLGNNVDCDLGLFPRFDVDVKTMPWGCCN